jgi:hypothetical protein
MYLRVIEIYKIILLILLYPCTEKEKKLISQSVFDDERFGQTRWGGNSAAVPSERLGTLGFFSGFSGLFARRSTGQL